MTALDPCLAVIPARGGSKGLPGKNIRPLAGLPLLQHSIECARLVPRIARTVVSTDSQEIAAVAHAVGGDVPTLRPPELAADDTPMMPVLQHALLERESAEGRRFGSVLLLDPTSPGRLPADISAAFDVLDHDSTCDGVLACSRPSFNPIWVGVFERDGYLTPAFQAERGYVRRQDVPTFYRINGALYLWRSEFVRHAPSAWLEGRHRMVEIPESRAFSIDDLFEFEVADLLVTRGLVRLPWVAPPAESIP
jgi:N-acylneuraminate cytidylyltransferase